MRDTVIYVDDEAINLLLFEKRFEKDFKVIVASSGTQALDQMQAYAGQLKAVISDMQMPGMNGLEFIQKARQKFTSIDYYILTGYSFNVSLEKALEEQIIRRIFKKPFDYEMIKGAVGV